MAIDRKDIENLINTVRDLYLSDDIPWVIGYSGGKDSTAVLQLVWLAIEGLSKEECKKTIHIINTDTLVESPVISQWAIQSLKKMKEASDKQKLPFIPHRLIPEYENTFWVNLLGRGYPFPRKKFRWCTDRLKIKPVNKFIKDRIAEHGEIIMVLGNRKAESNKRAKTMKNYEKKRVRELLSPNPTLLNELIFTPLSEWSDDDVWVFLMQYKNPWGYSNKELLSLYRGATSDNECPLMVEKDLPSCGKSRFGCWVCTMVERDKSMEAMIANDYDKVWMTPLLEFRNEFGDESLDRDRRSFRKSGGFLHGSYGKLHHGPYKKEIRESWLEKLLIIQEKINMDIPNDFENISLITIEELRIIRRIWVYDKHEFDDSLPGIYEKVTGIKFSDPEWLEMETFGKDEWDILKSVCDDLFPEEELVFEMMYSMIDVENQTYKLNQRKNILDKLEKCISNTFYKNEEDATKYYQDKISRKKELGGKYNEKFFAHIQNMTEEFDDEVSEAVIIGDESL